MGERKLDSIGFAAAFLLMASACGPGAAQVAETGAQKRICEAPEDTTRPLLADWSAADMASLITTAERQVVVVAYDGCTLELLDGCHLPGRYVFKETARARDGISVDDREGLYEKLPLGADNLEGELEGADRLSLSYVSVGTLTARISDRSKGMVVGDCDRATHFVHSMVTGAYELVAGKGGEEDVVRSGGDLEGCFTAGSPHDRECQAVVQAALMPLSQMSSDREDLYASVSDSVSMEEALHALSALAAAGQDGPEGAGAGGAGAASGGAAPAGSSPMSQRLSVIPDGGSDEWDVAVKPIMVEAYDSDGSGSIDTLAEVSAIPCEVLITLDRSIKAGRGGVSALRTTYGFPERYHWVGYALGFNEKVRSDADARLANCGL